MTGQTAAESSHRSTDEEESEALVQSGVVSDVEKDTHRNNSLRHG